METREIHAIIHRWHHYTFHVPTALGHDNVKRQEHWLCRLWVASKTTMHRGENLEAKIVTHSKLVCSVYVPPVN